MPTGIVLVQQAMVGSLRGAGVAAARRGRARTERAAKRENMVSWLERGLLGCKGH